MIIKLLVQWVVTALSLLAVAYIIPGFHVSGIQAALIAAVVIGLVNATIGLITKIITFPLTLLTLGLFLLVVNALMLMLSAKLVDGFAIDSFWSALFGGIVLSIVSSVLEHLFKGVTDKKKK